ncbi:MAG: hypothetical protein ACRCR1_09175, partial [Aeromonas sp.]
ETQADWDPNAVFNRMVNGQGNTTVESTTETTQGRSGSQAEVRAGSKHSGKQSRQTQIKGRQQGVVNGNPRQSQTQAEWETG